MATRNIPLLLLPLLLLASCVVGPGGPGTPVYYQPVYYGPGIGLGTLIAVLVSWSRNKSILLAILCGLLGWIYVIYAILVPNR
jgi:peptidoglycan/LPS O-acetylase OafA/YrhL